MSAFIDVAKVECPICQDVFQDACETSCGHGFCEYCLNQCLESKPGVCPVCQKNPSPIHPSYTLRAIVDGVKQFNDDTTFSASPCSSSSTSKEVEKEKVQGNACYNQKKYAEAIMHYSKALQVPKKHTGDKCDAILYNNRAQCYIKLEQYRRALDDCDEAIRFDKTDVKAFMRRGLCLAKLGDFEKSRTAYLTAKQLDTSKTWTDVINESLAILPNPRPAPQPTHQYQHQQQPQFHPPPFQPPQVQQQQHQQQQHQQQHYQSQQQQQFMPPFNFQPPIPPRHNNAEYPGQNARPAPPPPVPRFPPDQNGAVSCSTQ